MSGEDLLLLGSVACSGGFYVAAAIVYFLRRPLTPPDMPATSDVGQENPAVANLLANGGTVTPDAVPATLLDLAARRVIQIEEPEPHVYSVRIGGGAAPNLSAYESSVLSLLRTKASGGVVPAAALTTGATNQARSWFRSFAGEVVAEAKAAGLCSPRWPPRMLTVLGVFTGGALLLFVSSAVFHAYGWRQVQSGDCFLDVRHTAAQVPAFQAAGDGHIALQVLAANFRLAGIHGEGRQ